MWPGEPSERNRGGGERKRCGRGERRAMECSAHRLGTDLPHCDHTSRTPPIPFDFVLFRAHCFARRRRRPCDRDAQHRHACDNRNESVALFLRAERACAPRHARFPATRSTCRLRPAACGMARTRGPLRERDHDGGRQDREARGEPRLQRIRPRAAERGRRGCDDITQRPAVALLRAKGRGQPSRAHGYSVVSRQASARLSERIRRTHR